MQLSNWQILGLGIVIGFYLSASIIGLLIHLVNKAEKQLGEVLGND